LPATILSYLYSCDRVVLFIIIICIVIVIIVIDIDWFIQNSLLSFHFVMTLKSYFIDCGIGNMDIRIECAGSGVFMYYMSSSGPEH